MSATVTTGLGIIAGARTARMMRLGITAYPDHTEHSFVIEADGQHLTPAANMEFQFKKRDRDFSLLIFPRQSLHCRAELLIFLRQSL